MQACECEFQHYRALDGTCRRCEAGCYTCWGVSTNCSVCIDNYELVLTSCLFFQTTSFIVDASFGLIGPGSRCIQQITETCLNYCTQEQYQYQGLCYV